jgi:hypothetical protein
VRQRLFHVEHSRTTADASCRPARDQRIRGRSRTTVCCCSCFPTDLHTRSRWRFRSRVDRPIRHSPSVGNSYPHGDRGRRPRGPAVWPRTSLVGPFGAFHVEHPGPCLVASVGQRLGRSDSSRTPHAAHRRIGARPWWVPRGTSWSCLVARAFARPWTTPSIADDMVPLAPCREAPFSVGAADLSRTLHAGAGTLGLIPS